MTDDLIFARLPELLLPWYAENRRDLPWRNTGDPYRIWLSEIMLQQTRVEAVKPYYRRFLEAVPDIACLASCEDAALYKLWEGLGYYSRARNLKKAAQQIIQRHGGVFPGKYADILALSGIGAYTAGAISSIAFGQPRAAVDGNVLRFIARLTDNHDPIDLPARRDTVRKSLEAVYPTGQCGAFTQALMELGATVCVPNGQPKCDNCPCKDICRGYANGMAAKLPVRLPKKSRRQERYTVFILHCGEQIALERRPDTGLLSGLWQFPNVPGALELDAALETVRTWGLEPKEVRRQTDRTHIFTHIQWDMRGWYLEVARPGGGFVWLNAEQIQKEAALPTAFRQFWEGTDHV